MKLKQFIKKNKLFFGVGTIYLLLFLSAPSMARKAIDNSAYYLVEVLQILPVIFYHLC